MDIRESLALLKEQRIAKKRNPDLEWNWVSFNSLTAKGHYVGESVIDLYWKFKVGWDLPNSVGCEIYTLNEFKDENPYGHKRVDGDYIMSYGECLRFTRRESDVTQRMRNAFL